MAHTLGAVLSSVLVVLVGGCSSGNASPPLQSVDVAWPTAARDGDACESGCVATAAAKPTPPASKHLEPPLSFGRRPVRTRERQAIVADLARLEGALQGTAKTDAQRPHLLRRLADGYVELEHAAHRFTIDLEIDTREPGNDVAEARTAVRVLEAARMSAIKNYRTLLMDYPDWCRYPTKNEGERGCTDEVLYFLAYEYERAGEIDKARYTYLELTEKWKLSSYVPSAFVAFGEMFFDESYDDPSKIAHARTFYTEALKFPGPKNQLWGYASFRVGLLDLRENNIEEGRKRIRAARDFASAHRHIAGAAFLERVAAGELEGLGP